MPSGGQFTYADLARWPSGAEAVEIYGGSLLFSGQFTDQDAVTARRTYPDHEVHVDDRGLWVLPAGTTPPGP